jgi:arabinosaccharide transport system substrate-binding protein
MRFPYGTAAFVLAILALVSGIYNMLNRPKPRTADLIFWTFAQPHYDAYVKALPKFLAENPGVKVDLQLVSGDALKQRLQAAFQADLDVPDVCEIEISSAGSFFRGPVESVGFSPLNDRLKADGLDKRMVATRFAPYTSRGQVFGMPHDVHPVMFAYRTDLAKQAGIDVDKIKTWDDFIKAGQKFTVPGKQYMYEMESNSTNQLEAALFQRDGGFFDADGKVVLDNEVAVQTLIWYVPLVAEKRAGQLNPNRIGNSIGGGAVLTQAMEGGYMLFLITPDWRSKSFERDIGKLSGKMALMPMPAVKAGGRRTSTWGGTMIGITKKCQNQDLAWKFAKFLYTNDADLAERFGDTNILPPVKTAWERPEFKKPNAYYSGQKLGSEYAALANDVPPQYTHPFVDVAKGKMSEALTTCVNQYQDKGDEGFEAFVRATLKTKASEVRKQMERNPF